MVSTSVSEIYSNVSDLFLIYLIEMIHFWQTVIFLIPFASGYYVKTKYSSILTSHNFEDEIEDSNAFVLFIENPT